MVRIEIESSLSAEVRDFIIDGVLGKIKESEKYEGSIVIPKDSEYEELKGKKIFYSWFNYEGSVKLLISTSRITKLDSPGIETEELDYNVEISVVPFKYYNVYLDSSFYNRVRKHINDAWTNNLGKNFRIYYNQEGVKEETLRGTLIDWTLNVYLPQKKKTEVRNKREKVWSFLSGNDIFIILEKTLDTNKENYENIN